MDDEALRQHMDSLVSLANEKELVLFAQVGFIHWLVLFPCG